MITIEVKLQPAEKKYLEGLVATGLYGSNVGEAAERLIASKLQEKLDFRFGLDGLKP